MNCIDMQTHISAYMDGELAAPVREELERHIELCADCRGRLAAYRSISETLRRIAIPPLDPSYRGSLKAIPSMPDAVRPHRIPALAWIPLPLSLAAAVAAFSVFAFISPLLTGADAASFSRTAQAAVFDMSARHMFAPLNFARFCNACIEGCRCASGACGHCSSCGR